MFYPTTCVGLRYGPVTDCLAGFLGSMVTTAIRLPGGSRYYPVSPGGAYFTTPPIATRFNALFRQCAGVSLLRRRIAPRRGAGMLTGCPSGPPFGCPLGPDCA